MLKGPVVAGGTVPFTVTTAPRSVIRFSFVGIFKIPVGFPFEKTKFSLMRPSSLICLGK